MLASRMDTSSDAVVIGAGIVGAAIAYRLSERGLSVRVLEAAEAPATGSTGRSAAGVRVQFSSDLNVRLSRAGIEAYRTFEAEHGLPSGYRPQGYLFLVPEDAWPAHARAVEVQRAAGAPVEVLDPEAAQAYTPFDATGVHGATYGPIDGVVDPHLLTRGYLQLARQAGTTVHLRTRVEAATHAAGTWRLTTSTEGHAATFEAPLVVNAAGAWAGRVAAAAGLTLPVEPVRRMIFATGSVEASHPYPLTVDVATGTYLRGEGERVLFGRSDPNQAPGFVEGMDWAWLETTLEAALARFPWMAAVSLDRAASWWGYYEVTPDHDAILGRHPDADGWIDAAGFSGHGVQHAAMVARLIAEEAVDGAAHTLDLAPLRHHRFREPGSGDRETHIV